LIFSDGSIKNTKADGSPVLSTYNGKRLKKEVDGIKISLQLHKYSFIICTVKYRLF
jgi:hypothetical protein